MKTKRKSLLKGRTVKKQPPVSPTKGRTVKKQPPVSPLKGRKTKQQLPVSSSKRRTVKEQAPVPSEQSEGQRLPKKIKTVDVTRDSTPNIVDSRLERIAGTPNPTRVPGGGRFHS